MSIDLQEAVSELSEKMWRDMHLAALRNMEQRALRSEARYERLLRRYVALKAQMRETAPAQPQPRSPRPLDASAP